MVQPLVYAEAPRCQASSTAFGLEDAARRSIFGGLAASGWPTAALTMRPLVAGDFRPARGVVGRLGEPCDRRGTFGREIATPTAARQIVRMNVRASRDICRGQADRAAVLDHGSTCGNRAQRHLVPGRNRL